MRAALARPLLLAALAAAAACDTSRPSLPVLVLDLDTGETDDKKPGDDGDEEVEVLPCEPAVADTVEDLDASVLNEGDVEAWCSEAQTAEACAASEDDPSGFVVQTERECSIWTVTAREYACLPVWVDGKCCALVVFGPREYERCDE